ncbi:MULTISPECIES: molybdopterin molybdotransferase MoeA [unclassified Pseudodesulfovibrio]|uniref:molybdopterin molybdotransferase MoeA n=1 Tax=unclassified Pseudodesulfovibrio TaxID=2661612 RepID=UPI000FEBE687|nr:MULTISPECIES: molybdopterin molybdotransferase MoeA [unclassified Pseudodesulfovibrio]MCJ2166040.1 molybdopterin molybdotransferase MoeA [Pseudodesulfovibrio sp. S3-i]RWU02523.1 molybdopterin molybdenumtransferase MoeA [Pseudodesulfovibrio sp. S3]
MHTPISRQRAVQELLRIARPLKSEAISPMDGVGLVAAHDVKALCNVPEHACSVRDGYALRAEDVKLAGTMKPVRLAVGECIRAESTAPGRVGKGQTARVLTGGPIPPGADAVLAEEDVETENGDILVRTPVRSGWFVRAVGGEIRKETIITETGRIISPQAAAVMTRTRVSSVLAHPRPQARILALGSELAAPGCEEHGMARFPADNLILLRGLFEQSGAMVIKTGVMPDDENRLVKTLSATDLPDLVVTTGGTGNSERDFTRMAAQESGFTPIFSRIDIRPGRNMVAAVRGNTLLFCLPGPPAAVHACYHAVILPVVRRLRGLPDREQPLKARFTKGINVHPGSEWMVQCELNIQGSAITATPFAGKEVPPMFGLGRAHGLAVLQSGDSILRGEETEILTTLF